MTQAFIVRYPASALKSPVNQQIGAAERPWTHPLHTGGTLLMPNTVDVRTNADDDQSAYTGSTSLTSSLGRRPSIGNKDYWFPDTSFWQLSFRQPHKSLPPGRKSSTNRAHAAHLAQSSSTANVVCATSAVTVSVNSCGVGKRMCRGQSPSCMSTKRRYRSIWGVEEDVAVDSDVEAISHGDLDGRLSV